MKKKYKKCSECGEKKPNVIRREDPYEGDVHNKKVKRNLCNDCVKSLCDEI